MSTWHIVAVLRLPSSATGAASCRRSLSCRASLTAREIRLGLALGKRVARREDIVAVEREAEPVGDLTRQRRPPMFALSPNRLGVELEMRLRAARPADRQERARRAARPLRRIEGAPELYVAAGGPEQRQV